MHKTIKKLLVVSSFLVGALCSANASVLVTGSTVNVETYINGSADSTFSGVVGVGLDVDAFGYDIFLNEDVDQRTWYFQSDGSYCGWICLDDVVEFRFLNLDFGGAFSISDFTGFNDASYVINSDTSFSVFFTDTNTSTDVNEIFISGRFGDAVSQPVPVSGSVFLLGLALLGLAKRRLNA